MNKRNRNATEEELQDFINSGTSKNTVASRNQWGNTFLEHLKGRGKTISQMAVHEELKNELIRFYYSVKKLNGESYSIGSLRTSIGPLSAYLSDNIPGLERRISIHNDENMYAVRQMIEAVFKEGAKEGRDDAKNKSVLTNEQESLLYNHFKIDNPVGLLNRVLYIISKFGFLRGQGCHNFLLEWVKELPMNGSHQRSFEFTLPVEKNNQRGLSKSSSAKFSIPYECVEENNTFAFYLSKRPSSFNCPYLFLKPATDKVPNVSVEYPMGFWYNNQPATKNQTTKFIQKAVEDLKMQPGNGSGLTGHSIKATAITQLARAGVQDSEIMKSSRHKSSASLQHYKHNDETATVNALLIRPATSSSVTSTNVSSIAPLPLNPAHNISNQPFKRPAIRKPLARYPVNKPFKIPTFIKPK